MKKAVFFQLVILSLLLLGNTYAQTNSERSFHKILLPNGWSLTPAGESIPLGDLPLNLAISGNKNLMAVTNNGEGRQSIQLIDLKHYKVLDDITISKSWYGLKFSKNSRELYASAGNDNRILQYSINNNKLILTDSFSLSTNHCAVPKYHK